MPIETKRRRLSVASATSDTSEEWPGNSWQVIDDIYGIRGLKSFLVIAPDDLPPFVPSHRLLSRSSVERSLFFVPTSKRVFGCLHACQRCTFPVLKSTFDWHTFLRPMRGQLTLYFRPRGSIACFASTNAVDRCASSNAVRNRR